MKKFILVLLILGFSSTFALSDDIEDDIKTQYKENRESIDDYISSNSYIIEDYLLEGGRCKETDREYRDSLLNFYEFAENIKYTKQRDYLNDSNYIDNLEQIVLLQEKKSILQSGGTLTTVTYLSDGTEFTNVIVGYDGMYDSELTTLETKNKQIIADFKAISIKETNNYGKLQDHMSVSLLGTCFKTETKLEKIEIEKENTLEEEESIIQTNNTKLYEKLEVLETKKPGTLDTLLPLLKGIKDLEKYKKHSDIINTVIEYIENR